MLLWLYVDRDRSDHASSDIRHQTSDQHTAHTAHCSISDSRIGPLGISVTVKDSHDREDVYFGLQGALLNKLVRLYAMPKLFKLKEEIPLHVMRKYVPSPSRIERIRVHSLCLLK